MLQGQQAMMDTMGQAQAMTGGYRNSYAQTVGQQTYQGYLQQLNDRVPELYQLALDQHNQETQNLYNQYGLFADRENQEYGRYQDAVNNWNAERDYLTNRYDNERSYDYGKWADNRTFDYGKYSDEVTNQWKQKEFDMALERYKVQDEQWQKSYDLSKNSGSGGGGGSAVKEVLKNQGYNLEDATDITNMLKDFKDAGDTAGAMAFLNGLDKSNEYVNRIMFEEIFGYDPFEKKVIDTYVPPIGKASGGGGGTRRIDMIK
jgi:hypothetical protein